MWKGQREELVVNIRSVCYSLPSVTFRFLVTLFIKRETTIQFDFSFCFRPGDLDNEQTLLML